MIRDVESGFITVTEFLKALWVFRIGMHRKERCEMRLCPGEGAGLTKGCRESKRVIEHSFHLLPD